MTAEAITYAGTRGVRTPVGPDGYTERERQLLVLLSRGYRIPEASRLMGVNRNTLADTVKAILRKSDASTATEAVYRAVKEGVIQ